MKSKVSLARVLMVGLLVGGGAGAGCGGEHSPAGIGATGGPENVASPTPSLLDDLVSPPETEDLVQTRSALSGTGGSGGANEAEPRVIYLLYADGNPLPKNNLDACRGTPPKFNCIFGSSLLDCQRQVQPYLDRWYADFNVVFTLTRPTSGKFYTHVVSSGGGAWCGLGPTVAGVAPFLCNDADGGVSYTFRGGEDAKQTAVIIAHEAAHLVGLEHTTSGLDPMLPTVCTSCDGFPDVDNTVTGDRCNRPTQDSYGMLRDRLGLWSGGPKPSAFGCQPDSKPPTVMIMGPSDDSQVGHDFTVHVKAVGDCEVSKVEVSVMPQVLHAVGVAPPYDWDLTNISGKQTITVTATDARGAISATTITVDAPTDNAPPDGMANTGCNIGGSAPSPPGTLLFAGLALGFVARRRR